MDKSRKRNHRPLPARCELLPAPPSSARALRRPARVTAKTDASGAFSLAVPPGLYQVVVKKAGYASASTNDVVVAPGSSVPLTVTIAEQTLTSLRTIGSVTGSGRGGATINTGAATQSYVSGETFTQVANPQVNDVLGRIPDVVIQKLGTQQDTSIVVGGLQPYETQVSSMAIRSRSASAAYG